MVPYKTTTLPFPEHTPDADKLPTSHSDLHAFHTALEPTTDGVCLSISLPTTGEFKMCVKDESLS